MLRRALRLAAINRAASACAESIRVGRRIGVCVVVGALLLADRSAFAAPPPDSAAALHARYASFDAELARTPFPQPLVLVSSESSGVLEGEVFARIQPPYARVRAALRDPAHWCEVMILHINTKFCQASDAAGRTRLTLRVGKKTPEPLADTQLIEFDYREIAATPAFLSIRMTAADGPLGTRDYRIRLQAVPVGANPTFLRLTYAYGYGTADWR